MDGSSWHNSGLTFDNPPGFVDREESSSLGATAREPMSVEWTDEKHRLYITSMEASFVEQLYNSKNSFGWHSQTKHGSDGKSCGQGNTRASGQIKHLRRPDPHPAAYGHGRVRGKRDAASSSVQDADFFTNQHLSSGGHLSYCSGARNLSWQFTEVSDQNFIDEGCEPDTTSER